MEIKVCRDAAVLARLNEAVHSLHAKAYPDIFKPFNYLDSLDFFQKLLEREDQYFYAVYQGTEAIGYIWFQIISLMETPFRYGMKSLYIHQLSIEAAYRQQGHGHALMAFAETFAQQQGCQTVELDYWDKNLSAAFFYEKEGYENLRQYGRKKL